jgi:uncharacterized membrane protein
MMTDGMAGMMGPFMGLMMVFWILLWVLVLVVLALLAVWLFQQVRHGRPTSDGARAQPFPPETR